MPLQGQFIPDQVAGTTFRVQIEILDEDTGEPIDCSAILFSFAAAPISLFPSVPVLNASTAAGSIAVVELGVIEIVIPATNTNSTWPVAIDYRADMMAKTDDDDIVPIFLGQFSMLETIVRAP